MFLYKAIDWINPEDLAKNAAGQYNYLAFLFSSLKLDFTGNYSYLAFHKRNIFNDLEKIPCSEGKYNQAHFGYIGYDYKNQLEDLPIDEPSYINMPDICFVEYGIILVFDHTRQIIEIWLDDKTLTQEVDSFLTQSHIAEENNIEVESLSSNMSDSEYLQNVKNIIQAIKNGDLCQANLTRKFYGEATSVNHFEFFRELCQQSPSPYSVFMKFEDKYIISSSPEKFLSVNENGDAESRPIKGSAPRYDNVSQDNESRNWLENSNKDKAENLMIVDLMRNDFSKVCIPGSVKVDKLFETMTFNTIHHLVSTISGKLSDDHSHIDLIKACFPPGSMTGAPKIKAMELCSKLEKQRRGVYSGALGAIWGNQTLDLSVIIRTIIFDDNKFEFQVGGGIVSDSIPENELNEIYTKAKAILKTLKIFEQEKIGEKNTSN